MPDQNKNISVSAKEQLLKKGLAPKKSFGQNFMLDQRVNELFAQSVQRLGAGLPVVEIGAGTGSLTDHLVQFAPVVHAVERDRDLVPILAEHFAGPIATGKLVLHEADGARFDLSSCLSAEHPGILVGNLPYHLTSSIIFLALKNIPLLTGAVFMVQKEVADRLCSSHNCKQYGFLTVVLNIAFHVSMVRKIDRSCFWPVPKVDSAIISLKKRDGDISVLNNIDQFIIFVREIFQKRRKKLSTILGKTIPAADFARLGIDVNLRPENLEPQQFLALFLSTARLSEAPFSI